MKKSVTLSFLVFSSFMLFGFAASGMFNQSDPALANETSLSISESPNSIQSMNNGQRSILLIGVDSMNASTAHLSALWLVSYFPDVPTLHIFPISPSGNSYISDLEDEINRSFHLDEKDGVVVPSKNFTKLLAKNNYWWSGYVIFDDVALVNLLDSLVKENGDGLSQESVRPENSFSNQLAIFQAACQIFTGLPDNPDWSQFISLVPNHVKTDLDVQQLMNEWDSSLSTNNNPTCSFPTLQQANLDH